MVIASDDLDVMAEAYHRALEQWPGECSDPDITQSLIQGITVALWQGVRDEDELARAALAQAAIDTPADSI
jgi:hypothetical protein